MEPFRRSVPHIDATTDWLPRSQRLIVDRRRHPRALLSLPARLRWLSPLGLEAETSETLDAGRGGLLVSSREPRAEGTLVWVTFPFDTGASAMEPETPAYVARSKTTPSGGYLAGIAFANSNKHAHQTGDSDLSRNAPASNYPGGADRRRHARTRLALLIRILGADASWPEDTMTMDISHSGLLFCTLRIYEQGELVTVALSRSAWLSGGDRRARVMRIASHPSEPRLLCVGVEFLP
jgi:hypothetical protein